MNWLRSLQSHVQSPHSIVMSVVNGYNVSEAAKLLSTSGPAVCDEIQSAWHSYPQSSQSLSALSNLVGCNSLSFQNTKVAPMEQDIGQNDVSKETESP